MSGTSRKVFRQQMMRMALRDIKPCPVCGKYIDWRKVATRSSGETILVDTDRGSLSLLRYIQNVYPCRCTQTFDRLNDQEVARTTEHTS